MMVKMSAHEHPHTETIHQSAQRLEKKTSGADK